MDRTLKRPNYQVIEGITLPDRYNVDTFRGALKYKPRDDDVFVVTYPKCGTTWMQQIVLMIFRQGKPLDNPAEFWCRSPYLDMYGTTSVDLMPRPGPIKTHLPFEKIPYSPSAKYVFVTRNPWDCSVSFLHHTRRVAPNFEDGTFDEFFELFMEGEVEYGDYFDHLSSWYTHRNDPNVFFTTYECLKADSKKVIVNLARFLGSEFADALEPEVQENILKYSNFEYMQESLNTALSLVREGSHSSLMEDPSLLDGLKYILSLRKPQKKESNKKHKFIRKGVVGEWRDNFSETQSERLKKKFLEKTKGTDIINLWKGLGLPLDCEE